MTVEQAIARNFVLDMAGKGYVLLVLAVAAALVWNTIQSFKENKYIKEAQKKSIWEEWEEEE